MLMTAYSKNYSTNITFGANNIFFKVEYILLLYRETCFETIYSDEANYIAKNGYNYYMAKSFYLLLL